MMMELETKHAGLSADSLLKRRLARLTAYTWPNMVLLGATLLAMNMSLIRFMAWLTVRGYFHAMPEDHVLDEREVLVYASHYEYPSFLEEQCTRIQIASLVIVFGVMLGYLLWELLPPLGRKMRARFKNKRNTGEGMTMRQGTSPQVTMLIQHDWPFLKCIAVLMLVLCTFFLPARTERNTRMIDDPHFNRKMWLERSTFINFANTWDGLPMTGICLLAVIPIYAAHRMIIKMRHKIGIRRAAGWCVAWFVWVAGIILAVNIGSHYEEWNFPYGYQVTAPGKMIIGVLLALTNSILLYAALRIPKDLLRPPRSHRERREI